MKHISLRTILTLCATLALTQAAPTDDNAALPANPDFHSVKEILDLVPRQTIMKLKVPSQTEGARNDANTVLADKALGKVASWKIKVLSWEPWDSPGVVRSKFRIQTIGELMNVGGTPIKIQINAYLPEDMRPIVTKLSRGQEPTFTGYLNRVDITNNPGDGLRLNFDVTRTKLEGYDNGKDKDDKGDHKK